MDTIRGFNKFIAGFLFPFSQIRKEISEINHHSRFIAEQNMKRLEVLGQDIATLNGENTWMLKGGGCNGNL